MLRVLKTLLENHPCFIRPVAPKRYYDKKMMFTPGLSPIADFTSKGSSY